ncbi:MAG: NUDIX domain-containing protein [Chloroflexota bacterium]|nr:NUDIX domain-containing protein [Chloroflexota bacterium]MDE2969751.1 NUDIX domain-containing protein [Chloroflexota bacterium]
MSMVRAIAVVIPDPRDGALLLAVRRPDDDAELPGIWGLPATTVRPNESDADAAARLGAAKLGSTLTLGVMLGEGTQARAGHELSMTLYATTLGVPEPSLPVNAGGDGSTYYDGWRWAPVSALSDGAKRGSLCCSLALQAYGAGAQSGRAPSGRGR